MYRYNYTHVCLFEIMIIPYPDVCFTNGKSCLNNIFGKNNMSPVVPLVGHWKMLCLWQLHPWAKSIEVGGHLGGPVLTILKG